MTARSNRYVKQLATIKRKAQFLANQDICPLGRTKKNECHRVELMFEAMPLNLQKVFTKHHQSVVNAYYKPVVQGVGGEWYSAADMDSQMMHYS